MYFYEIQMTQKGVGGGNGSSSSSMNVWECEQDDAGNI